MEYTGTGLKVMDLPISLIDENVGQIEGVPRNPRKITSENFRKLMESIKKAPEMKELSEVLVYPQSGRYVVIGGNHRVRAYKKLGWETVLCKVLPEETPREKIREYVIRDNRQYAQDDTQLLRAWDVKELAAWDVPLISKGTQTGAELGDIPFTQVLNERHDYVVLYFDNEVDWLQAQTLFGLQKVRHLSTSKNKENSQGLGVGRILRGVDALNKLLGKKFAENENIG